MLDLELSMEQQFSLAQYTLQIEKATADQLRPLMVELMRQNLMKDNVVRSLMGGSKL